MMNSLPLCVFMLALSSAETSPEPTPTGSEETTASVSTSALWQFLEEVEGSAETSPEPTPTGSEETTASVSTSAQFPEEEEGSAETSPEPTPTTEVMTTTAAISLTTATSPPNITPQKDVIIGMGMDVSSTKNLNETEIEEQILKAFADKLRDQGITVAGIKLRRVYKVEP
ncbi:uncharacterized protein LOC143103138 [Alosa pseudoharengus]|uniref:uncharacterized protein LOC143103138 n=1 Tax=Alosa pseudoharengus TaxID=34774 RepID=UPI003F899815